MADPEQKQNGKPSVAGPGERVKRPPGGWVKLPAEVSTVLGETLMPLLLLLGGCAALLMTSQGAELAVLTSENKSQWAWIALAASAWSLVTWGWARELLTRRFGPREEWTTTSGKYRARLLNALAYPELPGGRTQAQAWALAAAVDWVPRVYAACPWFIAAGFALTGQESWLPFILLLAGGVAFMLLLPFRGYAARRLGQDRKPLAAPKTLWWVSFALVIATVLLFFLNPAFYGERLGTVGSAFLFFAVLLPPLALLGSYARRIALPVVSVFFVIFLGPALLDKGRHDVRRAGPEPANRLDLKNAAAAWTPPVAGAVSQVPDESPRAPTLFVVTTAGGGISAAMWTALLLGTVEDVRPGFAEHIFAVSGVSGGALGAAVFSAAVGPNGAATEEVRRTCKAVAASIHAAGGRCTAAVGYHALSPDFLGPTVAAYGFADTFAPYAKLAPGLRVPNRAQVLEEAWEHACIRAGCPAMAEGLHTLRDGLSWRPLLFFNGTHVQSGQRIITSQVRVTPRHFTGGALDFVALTGAEVRLSTAALNAARFPYVTPVGLMRNAEGKHLGHIADGGYYENYGSETGAEIVQSLREQRKEVRLVLVEISSDPSLRANALERYGAGSAECPADKLLDTPLALAEPGMFAKVSAQVVGPPISLYHTRSARGVVGATRAARALECGPEEKERRQPRPWLVQFALCPLDKDDSRPPLGWSLSVATKQRIRADVEALHGAAKIEADDCRERNRRAMQTLLSLVPQRATTAAVVVPQR